MIRTLAITLAAASATFAGAWHVGAEEAPSCYGTPAEAAAELEERWDEHPAYVLLSVNNTIVTLFVARDQSSWSAVRSSADGRTCIVEDGGEAIAFTAPAPGEDS